MLACVQLSPDPRVQRGHADTLRPNPSRPPQHESREVCVRENRQTGFVLQPSGLRPCQPTSVSSDNHEHCTTLTQVDDANTRVATYSAARSSELKCTPAHAHDTGLGGVAKAFFSASM